jgi:putative DNA primase/helicase
MDTVTVGEVEIPLPNYEQAAAWFRRYRQLGFSPVHWTVDPARTGKKYGNDGKGPRIRDWNLIEYVEPPPCERQYQMGLMTGKEIAPEGKPSGRFLVCVDVDDSGLQEEIDKVLPATALRGGKRDTPKAHMFYSTEARMNSFKWEGQKKDGSHGCLLEIISMNSHKETSCQVVVAPSRHYDTATDIDFVDANGNILKVEDLPAPTEVSAKIIYDACVFALKANYPAGGFVLAKGKGLPILWDRGESELLALQKAAQMSTDDDGRPKRETFDANDARRTIDHAVWELEKVEPGNVNAATNALVFTAATLIAGGCGSETEKYLKELGDRCLEAYDVVEDRYPGTQNLSKWEYTIGRAIAQGRLAPRQRSVLQAYKLTDAGTTELFADEWRGSYRFCTSVATDGGSSKSGNGEWYAWDGCRWEQTTVDQVVHDSKHVVRWAAAEAAASQDKVFRANAVKYYYKAENRARSTAAITGLKAWLGRGGLAIPRDAMDGNQWALSCANGTFDIKEGVLKEFRREDLCTKSTKYKYVPNSKLPAKLMEAMLKTFEAQPDPDECVRYLMRWFGYMATGDTSEQKLLILHGGGRNGKTMLLQNIIGEALGDYMSTVSQDVIIAQDRRSGGAPSPELVDIQALRMGLYSESSPGDFLNEGRIKQLTGSTEVKARQVFGSFFTYIPTCKFVIDTNYMPKIRGTDFGILRRLRPVPFARQIPEAEVDKFFAQKLMAEHGDAVLSVILDEAHAYSKEGLLPEPKCVKDEVSQFAEDNDVIGCFLTEMCEIDESARWSKFGDAVSEVSAENPAIAAKPYKMSDYTIGASELYQSYKKWAVDGGYVPLNIRNFTGKMKDAGWAQPPRNAAGMVWNGVRLRPAPAVLG